MPYSPRSYPLVPIPQPQVASPIQPLMELAQLGRIAAETKADQARTDLATREQAEQDAIASAFQQSGGDLDQTISALESQGQWNAASGLRKRAGEIRTAQQQALEAGLKRTREGFQTATSMLQGVEAAETPEEKSRLFATIRPKLVEALPGFESYIPPTYEDDPGFVGRAIPFGLSVTEAAKRREDAITQLNRAFTTGGDRLTRDKNVLDALGPWIETADTGDEVQQIVDQAEKLYGASPAVRARFADVPTGPLSPAQKAALAARLKTPTEAREPGSIEGAILAAQRKGDTAEVNRLLALRGRVSAASREPDHAPNTAVSQAQKAAAERWKQNALAELEKRYRDPLSQMSQAELDAEKARIQASYVEQIGATGAPTATPPAAPAPPAARSTAPTKGQVVTLRNGKRVRITKVYPDGSFDGDEVQ